MGKTIVPNDQALASDILSMLNYGLAANIPAAADVLVDSLYYETDTKILKQEQAGVWVEIARGETVIRLAQLGEKSHANLDNIGKGHRWTLNKLLLGAGVGADPTEIDIPGATREFFIPVQAEQGATKSATAGWARWQLTTGDYITASFKIPHDFTTLTHCYILVYGTTNGNIDWTATTLFGTPPEHWNGATDTTTADGLALTDNDLTLIDISAAFDGIAADDWIGIKFLVDVLNAGNCFALGFVFKYS